MSNYNEELGTLKFPVREYSSFKVWLRRTYNERQDEKLGL